jgi:dienelactone hydrolase
MLDSAWDMMKVIDYLVTRQDVDESRIGTTGVSLGGMHSWMAAVADPRIAVVAPAIGAQSYAWAVENASWVARVDTIKPVFDEACKDLGKEAVDEKVVVAVWDKLLPGILDELDGPSSLPTLAPRPLLICNGELDPRCPVPGVNQIAAKCTQEYAALGCPENFELHIEKGVAHAVTKEMWVVIEQFLDKHLQPSAGRSSI